MNRFWCGFFIVWPIVAVAACWIAPSMNWWFPGEAQTPMGGQIDNLFYLVLVIVTVVYIGVHLGLGYVLVKGISNREGRALFSHGSHTLETVWTIIPAGILIFISLYQLDVWAQFRVQSRYPEDVQPIAEVTARQFEWRIRYPAPGKQLQMEPQSDDLYTVNDLHLPTNRPILIRLRSGDVQHSFFVPDLRVKQDAVPGQVIPVWFEVIRPGEYDLTCAELCGWGHYKMRGRVMAESDVVFEAYLKRLQQEQFDDGVSDPSQAQESEVAQ